MCGYKGIIDMLVSLSGIPPFANVVTEIDKKVKEVKKELQKTIATTVESSIEKALKAFDAKYHNIAIRQINRQAWDLYEVSCTFWQFN